MIWVAILCLMTGWSLGYLMGNTDERMCEKLDQMHATIDKIEDRA